MSIEDEHLHKCIDYYQEEVYEGMTILILVTELMVCDLCDLLD